MCPYIAFPNMNKFAIGANQRGAQIKIDQAASQKSNQEITAMWFAAACRRDEHKKNHL
jgi:hypothetical protein